MPQQTRRPYPMEHADELADLLFAVEPNTGDAPQHLYFDDEVPRQAEPNKAANA